VGINFKEKGLFEISENKNLSKITSYTVVETRFLASILNSIATRQQIAKEIYFAAKAMNYRFV